MRLHAEGMFMKRSIETGFSSSFLPGRRGGRRPIRDAACVAREVRVQLAALDAADASPRHGLSPPLHAVPPLYGVPPIGDVPPKDGPSLRDAALMPGFCSDLPGIGQEDHVPIGSVGDGVVLHAGVGAPFRDRHSCEAGRPGSDLSSVDAALGGGLVLGGVHEFEGLVLDEDAGGLCDDIAEPMVGCHGRPAWIVPFGCVLHVVHRAMAHPRLAGRAIAWIGSKVCPQPAALPSKWVEAGGVHVDETVLDGSIFVPDFALSQGARQRTRLPWNGGCDRVRALPNSAQTEASRLACARVWCAEQAIRLGAVGIVVLDGTGLDHVMWRRLQLAAGSGMRDDDHSGEETDMRGRDESPRGSESSLGGRLVLVVTPPSGCDRMGGLAHDSAGREHRRGHRRFHGASTVWRVRACMTADGPRAFDAPFGRSLGFDWRMELVHARPKSSMVAPRVVAATPRDAEEASSRHGVEDRHECAVRIARSPWADELHAGISDGRLAVTVSKPCDLAEAMVVDAEALRLLGQSGDVRGAEYGRDAFEVRLAERARSA
ncbi:MAG: hypothetical protein GC172_10850 [Phycisphaera sp.]|nr:hypothetical protein [Phycisphaera sp.]